MTGSRHTGTLIINVSVHSALVVPSHCWPADINREGNPYSP